MVDIFHQSHTSLSALISSALLLTEQSLVRIYLFIASLFNNYVIMLTFLNRFKFTWPKCHARLWYMQSTIIILSELICIKDIVLYRLIFGSIFHKHKNVCSGTIHRVIFKFYIIYTNTRQNTSNMAITHINTITGKNTTKASTRNANSVKCLQTYTCTHFCNEQRILNMKQKR